MSNAKNQNDELDKAKEQNPASASAKAAASANPEEDSADNNAENSVARLQNDMERFKDLAMRSLADLDNYRKRAAREKEDAIKYANASFLEKLIPIFDNFELGLAAARSGNEGSSILSGMEMVLKQLNDFLSDAGVQVIDALGQPFDPNLHEALAQEASDSPEGTVVRQIRKGYKLKDRLLRPANVIVSKGNA
jgi:molecular chaperone GrpE